MLARHELAHAATLGHGHDSVWKDYHRAVGGDGRRCDESEHTEGVVGHRVEVYCEVTRETRGGEGSGKHFFEKRQVRRARNRAQRVCKECRKEDRPGTLFTQRVPRTYRS